MKDWYDALFVVFLVTGTVWYTTALAVTVYIMFRCGKEKGNIGTKTLKGDGV